MLPCLDGPPISEPPVGGGADGGAALGRVVVTPLALAETQPVHEAQLLSQLRLGGWSLGLLINFNTIRLADGLRRFVLSRGK